MSDILGYTEPFADFMTGKGMRFLLIAYDGDEAALNYNVDDEITAASVMPSIVCEAMEKDYNIAALLTHAFMKYIQRNGNKIDISAN